MPRQNVALQTFNRGVVSPKALARTDIEKVALGAEEQTNWLPMEVGPMRLRPGTQFIGSLGESYLIPFHRSQAVVGLLEFSAGQLRIWSNDALVSRSASAGAVSNGDFSNGLTGWQTASEANGSVAAINGVVSITGSGFDEGILRQQVGGAGSLRITVDSGPVHARIGTAAGLADLYDAELDAGTHSLVIDQAFWIDLANDLKRPVKVSEVNMDSVGPLVLPGFASITNLRYAQSADVVFLAADGEMPMKVERRDNGSWGFSEHLRDGGPFNLVNTSSTTITPSAISGAITLTASRPLFEARHVGKFFRLDSESQYVEATLSGPNQWTDPIRTSGVGAARDIAYSIAGSGSMSISLQLSLGGPGDWADLIQYSANGSAAFDNDDPSLDGQVVYFRMGVQADNYTSGTKTVSITYDGGSIHGVARITAVTSSTVAQAEVHKDMGDANGTANWYEDAWGKDYPSSVELYEGRLWWFGKNRIWASVSDDYPNMDNETEGDSGPIDRTIGKGPVNRVEWSLGLQRLLLGTSGNEISVRSSSLDEPLTPTNFNQKPSSNQGSYSIDAIEVDDDGIFVQRSGTRVYLLTVDGGDYKPFDLTLLQPEFCESGVKRLMLQRKPNTRVHCVLNNGKVAMLTFNPAEELRCWTMIESDGLIEDCCVIPGDVEDQVYYTVNRVGFRSLEKWSDEDVDRLLDAHVVGTGPTISGLDHLEGEEVHGWNGTDLGPQTVVSGSVTFAGTSGEVIVGKAYRARYRSTKLAYAAAGGTALTMRKTIEHLGLVMANTHSRGLKIGHDFVTMDDLPTTADWDDIGPDHIYEEYDYDVSGVLGGWSTDIRLCLEANSPRPCTVMAAIVGMNTNG